MTGLSASERKDLAEHGMSLPDGILAYDLEPPERLLTPGPKPGVHVDEVKLAGQSAKLQRIRRESGEFYRLVIDCDNMPHCGSCECAGNHYIQLLPEVIEAMKGLLP